MSLYKKALLSAALIFGIAATTFAQMRLDLDQKPGDQRLWAEKSKPGEMKTVQLLAVSGAKDIQGFEIELWFNPKKVTVKSFQPTGIMAGAMALPMQTLKPGNVQGKKRPGGVKLSVGFLGGKSKGDKGILGTLLIQLGNKLGKQARIALVKGSYGVSGKTQTFDLRKSGGNIIFYTGDRPHTPKKSGVRKQTRPQKPGVRKQTRPPKPGRASGSRSAKPAELIKALPKALQGSVKKTFSLAKAAAKERLTLELTVKKSRLKSLTEMNMYLPMATDDEKVAISDFLLHMTRKKDPKKMSDGKRPTRPRGGPPGPPPNLRPTSERGQKRQEDVKIIIKRMINEISDDIKKISGRLAKIR